MCADEEFGRLEVPFVCVTSNERHTYLHLVIGDHGLRSTATSRDRLCWFYDAFIYKTCCLNHRVRLTIVGNVLKPYVNLYDVNAV